MSDVSAHIVHVGRDKSFTSESLPTEALARLESNFRAGRWWQDRWSDRAFRSEARHVLRQVGGLVLIGPGVRLEERAAFGEFFEAIEIASPTSGGDPRLKTVSGEAPTRQERYGAVFKTIGIVMGVLLAAGLVIGFFIGLPFLIVKTLLIAAGAVVVLVYLTILLLGRRSRCFLVPGGIAIVRRGPRRGARPRITVFSASDSCLVFRLMSTGKTVVLVMELWTHVGRVVRRAVTEREAISVLAVWRSGHAPLEDDQLEAMLSY